MEDDRFQKHGEALREVLDSTCWIYFLGCYGDGCTSQVCDPLITQDLKICCLRRQTYTTDCCGEEGWCHGFSKVCCCVTVSTFPPTGRDGIPICAICNKRCGGGDGAVTSQDVAKVVKETFLCYYFICQGYGCDFKSPCSPLLYGDSKFFCLQDTLRTEDCSSEETGCCFNKQKICCHVEGYACPPGGGGQDGLPMCAFCGMKCGGEQDDGSESNEEGS